MNRHLFVMIFLLTTTLAVAQFKSPLQTPIKESISKPVSALFLGLFNPARFNMSHSFSSSFLSSGGRGLMVNSYVNTINYQISDPLKLSFNLGLMNTPYNTFTNPGLNTTNFFGGAELQYRPSENTALRFSVDVAPNLNYLYSPYYLKR